MLTKSKKLLNAVKKLYTKVTGGKTTKSNDLPTVIDSMAENYVGGGGGGETPHLYEIKVSFADEFLELTCLSTESINNLDEITNDTVITDAIWNDLIKLKDKMYDIHLHTTSDSALLGNANIQFGLDKRTGEVKRVSIWADIYYPDPQTQNYNVSGQESNSIDITKLVDNQGYEVSCYGTRLPRKITCTQIF